MTRKERAEKRIEKHLRAIERIYESIDPEGDMLCMSIGEKYMTAFNRHWEKAPANRIDITIERFGEDDFDS